MKNFLLVIAIPLFIIGCQGEDSKTTEIETSFNENSTEVVEENESDKIIISPGEFVEYHPNGAIKMKGRYDKNNLRTGLWISYYDSGIKWSESYYVEGKKDGHSLTFYPNGQIRYRGEYDMDKKIGTWVFYDESGKIANEENY